MRWILLASVFVGAVVGCDEQQSTAVFQSPAAHKVASAANTHRPSKAAEYRERLRQLRQEIWDENIAANYRRAIEWEKEYLEDTKRFNEPSILYEGGKEIKKVIWETEDEWARKGIEGQLRIIRQTRKEMGHAK